MADSIYHITTNFLLSDYKLMTTNHPMKKALQILKGHPGAIICYILYALFCLSTITSSLRFQAAVSRLKHGERMGVSWGEGVMFGEMYTFIIAIIFIVIIIFNALLRKTGQSFYWWLCLFIVIPLVILIKTGG